MTAPHPRIKLLPDHLINQIAAGEVIERPASVVKELLDNSLDAGATDIRIDIENGGIGLIRVRDNGHGIQQQDLVLAVTRHATSKISSLNDLQRIMTMGFRGEALPSVGAISRLNVVSRSSDADLAWSIRAEGRTEQFVAEPASHPSGTTIEVRDLFFNTPARRKYMRTERTEFYQIQQLVRHFAIAHPQVAIKLSHNGKSTLNLKPSEPSESIRVEAILGKKFLQNMAAVDQSFEGLRLAGWLGLSEVARTINDSQFFCLNDRCVRDKRVNHAVGQAYHNLLPAGRYPAYALYLTIEPAQVDVNVHPAKTEVRFREGRTVHDFIYSVIHGALQGNDQPALEFSAYPGKITKKTQKHHSIHTARRPSQNSIQEAQEFYRSANYAQSVSIENDRTDKNKLMDSSSSQIGNIIVIKKQDELILVDKLAAARLLLREQLRSVEKQELKTPLLFPMMFSLTTHHLGVLRQYQGLLNKLGFDCHLISDDRLQLRQVPDCLSKTKDIEDVIKNIAEYLGKNDSDPEESLINILLEYQSKSIAQNDIELLLEIKDTGQSNGLAKVLTRILKRLTAADLLKIIQAQ